MSELSVDCEIEDDHITTSNLQARPKKIRKRPGGCFNPRNRMKKRKAVSDQICYTHSECCFCHGNGNEICGTFFQDKTNNIAAHQFCLLFSAGLPQAGDDEEGFEGFILKDIQKECQRASKLTCRFCEKPGASSGCCVKTCRTTYHFKCGLEANVQFVYANTFDTYCDVHRSCQDLNYLNNESVVCPVCLDDIDQPDPFTIIKTPCCKNVFVHRECVQRQAYASGYFFKCPTCNNQEAFQNEMVKYGVYIPQRDATWEENNAFADLLIQYDRCDNKSCLCPDGVTHISEEEDTDWELLRCYHCGQGAVHRKCLGDYVIPKYEYICSDCNEVVGEKIDIVSVTPSRFEQRNQEHKKRLAQLKERCDPVLLASTVLSSSIWLSKHKIRKCQVIIQPIRLEILLEIRNFMLHNASVYYPHLIKHIPIKILQENFLRHITSAIPMTNELLQPHSTIKVTQKLHEPAASLQNKSTIKVTQTLNEPAASLQDQSTIKVTQKLNEPAASLQDQSTIKVTQKLNEPASSLQDQSAIKVTQKLNEPAASLQDQSTIKVTQKVNEPAASSQDQSAIKVTQKVNEPAASSQDQSIIKVPRLPVEPLHDMLQPLSDAIPQLQRKKDKKKQSIINKVNKEPVAMTSLDSWVLNESELLIELDNSTQWESTIIPVQPVSVIEPAKYNDDNNSSSISKILVEPKLIKDSEINSPSLSRTASKILSTISPTKRIKLPTKYNCATKSRTFVKLNFKSSKSRPFSNDTVIDLTTPPTVSRSKSVFTATKSNTIESTAERTNTSIISSTETTQRIFSSDKISPVKNNPMKEKLVSVSAVNLTSNRPNPFSMTDKLQDIPTNLFYRQTSQPFSEKPQSRITTNIPHQNLTMPLKANSLIAYKTFDKSSKASSSLKTPPPRRHDILPMIHRKSLSATKSSSSSSIDKLNVSIRTVKSLGSSPTPLSPTSLSPTNKDNVLKMFDKIPRLRNNKLSTKPSEVEITKVLKKFTVTNTSTVTSTISTHRKKNVIVIDSITRSNTNMQDLSAPSNTQKLNTTMSNKFITRTIKDCYTKTLPSKDFAETGFGAKKYRKRKKVVSPTVVNDSLKTWLKRTGHNEPTAKKRLHKPKHDEILTSFVSVTAGSSTLTNSAVTKSNNNNNNLHVTDVSTTSNGSRPSVTDTSSYEMEW